MKGQWLVALRAHQFDQVIDPDEISAISNWIKDVTSARPEFALVLEDGDRFQWFRFSLTPGEGGFDKMEPPVRAETRSPRPPPGWDGIPSWLVEATRDVTGLRRVKRGGPGTGHGG